MTSDPYYQRVSDMVDRTRSSIPEGTPEGRGRRGLDLLRKVLVAVCIAAVVLASATYAGDYILLRYRAIRNRGAFGTVQVQRYYAVQQKSGKTEFIYDQPVDQTCSHSLFPHLGLTPCWYLSRHPDQRIDM